MSDWYNIEDLKEQVEDLVFYVAEKDGEIIIFIHATVADRKASLHRIYLDREYQNPGIGSKLYDKAEEAQKPKADLIELEVLSENKIGANFYEHKGFTEKKEEEIELKGEKVRQKILTKELD